MINHHFLAIDRPIMRPRFISAALILLAFATAHAQFGIKATLGLEGVVVNEVTNKPVSVTVEVFDSKTHEKAMTVRSNSATGSYYATLKPGGCYQVRLSADGFFTQEEDICTPTVEKYAKISKDFSMRPSGAGTELVLDPVPFDFKKRHLRTGADEGLFDLVKLFTLNPKVKIEIVSYPDFTSPPEMCVTLTEGRCAALKNFFVDAGIEATRIEVKSNATTDPKQKFPTKRMGKGKRPVGNTYIRVL